MTKHPQCSLTFMEKWTPFCDSVNWDYKQVKTKWCCSRSQFRDLKKAVVLKRKLEKEIEKDGGYPPLSNWDECQPSHYIAISEAPENKQLELVYKVAKEKLTVQQLQKEIKRIQIAQLETHTWSFPEDVKMVFGDFIEKGVEIPTSSVDAIITDPPYGKDSLDLWDELGKLAQRVLKPSCYLIAYSGQLYLGETLKRLNIHLDYYWTVALLFGNRDLVSGRNIYCEWKPILVFFKPPLLEPNQFIHDVLNGSGREKDYHEWQQSKSELTSLIESFVPEKGLILDPMAGSGTTLIAAKNLGRKVIGIEKDELSYRTLMERLKNEVGKTEN